MYIIDDICYAGELTEDIQVAEARPLRGGMMLVTFSTGETRLFDTTTLQGPAFEPLAEEKIFIHPVIHNGGITWNNGEIDIAPKTVYRNSYPYDSTLNMNTKTATVTADVDPDIKQQAEAILDELGVSVADLIEALYRQIILTGAVPFPLDLPTLSIRDGLTEDQFNSMMETGYDQAESGEGLPVDEAFEIIRKGI